MVAIDPAQRRDEIVAATWGLLVDGGVEAATMRRIATAADATTGRVTHHFASRTEVLVAALVEVDRRRQVRIGHHAGLDAVDQLRSVLIDYMPLDTFRLHEQRVWMALSSTGIPELRDEVGRQQAEWDRRVEDLVSAVRGPIRDSDLVPMMLGAVVAGLSQRLALDATHRSRRDAERVLDDVLAAAGLAD